MTETELQTLWDEAKARIGAVNGTKQAVRTQARAKGVPFPASERSEQVSEQVAFDGLKAANAGVEAARTVLAQSEAAFGAAKTTFGATVDEKVALIVSETRYWQQGLQAASVPPPAPVPPPPAPVLRSFRSLSVDPDALAKVPEAAQPFVQEVAARVQAGEKGPTNKGINEVFDQANKESVWRTGHQFFGALELLGRAFGTAMHVTESARLFDVIVPRLTERQFTRNGKTITVWEMGFNRLSKTPDNDKEDAGGWTTMRRVVSNMARNLKTHPENEGRVRLGKKLIRANEDKWLLIKGGDPDWRIPNERTLHTALARLGGFIRDLSMEDDSGIRKELEASIAKWTPLLADEFLPYDDHLTGEPCVTWCYNSLVATVKAGVTPGSDRHLTDTAHLGVYCLPVTASVFELGLEGLDYFSRADLQRRVGNGLWFALFADRPYKYRVFDEGAWHEGQGDMNMDISPRSMSCNDSDEYKVRAKKGEMKRRMKGYATGAPRILEHGDEWREGGNHRRAPYGVEAFPQGQAWLFAHEGYKKMSERELIGTPKDPIITTPMILSTFAGRAFAETYRAEGRADFR